MPAHITVESVDNSETIYLGETFIPNDLSTLGNGEETRVVVRNDGTTVLREIEVAVEGGSKQHVQLAVDLDGDPGMWTNVGGSILACKDAVEPGKAIAFWARTFYSPDDAEGRLTGEFIIHAISA